MLAADGYHHCDPCGKKIAQKNPLAESCKMIPLPKPLTPRQPAVPPPPWAKASASSSNRDPLLEEFQATKDESEDDRMSPLDSEYEFEETGETRWQVKADWGWHDLEDNAQVTFDDNWKADRMVFKHKIKKNKKFEHEYDLIAMTQTNPQTLTVRDIRYGGELTRPFHPRYVERESSAGRGRDATMPYWKKCKQEQGHPTITGVQPPTPPPKPLPEERDVRTPSQESEHGDETKPEAPEEEAPQEGVVRLKEEEDGSDDDEWGDFGVKSEPTGTSEEWTGKEEAEGSRPKRVRAKRYPGQARRGAKRPDHDWYRRGGKGDKGDKGGKGGSKGSKQGMAAIVTAAAAHTGETAEMFCYVNSEYVVGAFDVLAMIGFVAIIALFCAIICYCKQSPQVHHRKSRIPYDQGSLGVQDGASKPHVRVRSHNEVARKPVVGAVPSVPQTIYVSAAVAGTRRSFHLSSTCRHLVGATQSTRVADICKTCEKNQQASD